MTLTGRFLGFSSFLCVLSACSVSSTGPLPTPEPASEASPGTPARESSDSAALGPVCSPSVTGFVDAGIAPLNVECPLGWQARTGSKTLPIAGRFSTREELTNAYCVRQAGDTRIRLDSPTTTAIDFDASDVVAYAYDANAGAPALLRRGPELWIELTSDACSGRSPALSGVAFVVPKGSTVDERTCSQRCQ